MNVMSAWGVRVRGAAACLLALALAACTSAGPPTVSMLPETGGPLAEHPAPDHAHDASEYVIGPGDQLSVFVYQSPQLSVPEVAVRPDGRISIPLVPDIVAAGRTPAQLSQDVTERLRKYVQDPNVTVMVHGFVGPFSRQVRVIGEAAEPAAIPYRERMTLLDVMIQTKGLTKYAAGNRAVIVRRDGGRQEAIHVHLSALLKDGDVSQNVAMEPGDILIIPQSWF